MPAQTPRYGFPYPLPGDPITDGADIIQQLAEAVEARILAGGGGGGAPAGPGILGAYTASTYTPQVVSGNGRAVLATVSIPDPGRAYRLLPFAQFEAGHFNPEASKPVIYAVTASVNGPEVGRGLGPNTSDWQSVILTPTGTRTFTGDQTVYFVLTSALGGRTVNASNYLATATVYAAAV